MSTRFILALLLLVLTPGSPLQANFYPVHALGLNKTPLPLRGDLEVPEGKTLVGLSYSVSYDGGSVGSVRIYRTLESTVGQLGVYTSEIGEDLVEDGQRPYEGLHVNQVVRDTPAFRAGLLAGDVLLTADGMRLSNPNDFNFQMKYHAPDQPVHLKVRRGATISEMVVELARKKVRDTDLETHRVPVLPDHHTGMVLGDLSGEVARYFAAGERRSVVVLAIRGGSPAFYSDLRLGDVITDVDGEAVNSAAELDSMLGGLSGSDVTLGVLRGQDTAEPQVEPRRSLPEGFSFKVPLVLEWKQRMPKSRFRVGMGLVGRYERDSYLTDDGERVQNREWGLVLDLIHYENQAGRRKISLLWLIHWSW